MLTRNSHVLLEWYWFRVLCFFFILSKLQQQNLSQKMWQLLQESLSAYQNKKENRICMIFFCSNSAEITVWRDLRRKGKKKTRKQQLCYQYIEQLQSKKLKIGARKYFAKTTRKRKHASNHCFVSGSYL